MKDNVNTNVDLQYLDVNRLKASSTNPRKTFGISPMKELVSSVIENGIIQPLLVRSIEDDNYDYEVICGNRRLIASIKANLSNVPCMIKQLTNDEVVQVQIIENLQRENVHPLQEAEAFKSLLNFEGFSNKMIADKIGKSITYVVNRLQLNTLIEDFKTKMYNDKSFTITHALLVCKLLPKQQHQILESIKQNYKQRISVNELSNSIQKYLNNNSLDNVLFDIESETVIENIGSCIKCSKRSIVQPILFSEFENGNNCLDTDCLEIKKQAHFMFLLREILNDDEDICFLDVNDDLPESIRELVEIDNKKKIYSYRNEVRFLNTNESEGAIKVFILTGHNKGTYGYIKLYTKDESKKEKKLADLTPLEQIERLEAKEIRSKELDQEKIQKRLVSELSEFNGLIKRKQLKASIFDDFLIKYTLLNSTSWQLRSELKEKFELNKVFDSSSKLIYVKKELKKLKADDMAYIVRRLVFEQNKSSLPQYLGGKVIKELAKQFENFPLDVIEKEQNTIAVKRQSRLKERIEGLKEKTVTQ